MKRGLSKTGQATAPRRDGSADEFKHILTAQRADLIELWAQHFGQPPPKGMSTVLTRRAVAYHVQEKDQGGLRRAEQATLLRWAGLVEPATHHASFNDGVPTVASKQGAATFGSDMDHSPASNRRKREKPSIQSPLRPGTRLVRNWQGKSHVVEVRADGFAWNGMHYASLSAVAHAITDAKWSGPRFFRL